MIDFVTYFKTFFGIKKSAVVLLNESDFVLAFKSQRADKDKHPRIILGFLL